MLALAQIGDAVVWSVVDPFEVRSTGTVPIAPWTSIPRVVRRLVRCTKPTAIATTDRELAKVVGPIAEALGLPLVTDRFQALPAPIAADLFPEFAAQCPTKPIKLVTTHAIAVVLHARISARKYEKTLRPRTSLRVA